MCIKQQYHISTFIIIIMNFKLSSQRKYNNIVQGKRLYITPVMKNTGINYYL